MGVNSKLIRKTLTKLGYYCKPDFMIIGAQKAGTSSLFKILKQHSLIESSIVKEVHFFDDDEWFGENKYHTYHWYFPLPHEISMGVKLFEATPRYLYHPGAAERLYRYNKNLKLIILLRNPVDRAYSAWKMYHYQFEPENNPYHHLFDPMDFGEAISYEMELFDSNQYFMDTKGYIKRGLYYSQIINFMNYFNSNSMLTLESNQLLKNHNNSISMILNFLQLPYEVLNQEIENISSIEISEINEINGKVKENLEIFYHPHNEKLFHLLNTRFTW